MTTTGPLVEKAAALRRAFDLSFSEPRQAGVPPRENLLAVRIGEAPYAIRMSAIAAVALEKPVTRLPTSHSSLLGVAAFRDGILPVYDLSALLGHGAAVKPRWFLVAAREPVAFALDGVDGYLRLSPDAMGPRGVGVPEMVHLEEVAHGPDGPRPIVELRSVLDDLMIAVSTTLV